MAVKYGTVALPLEPVLHVVIFVSPEFAVGVEGCVLRYRGRLESSKHREGVQTIRALLPQAAAGPFVSALMADTNGTARTAMRLCEFWPTLERPPGDPTTGVREPRPNVPVLRNGAIAVPEPKPGGDSG
jgi:translation elongation factor EF-G